MTIVTQIVERFKEKPEANRHHAAAACLLEVFVSETRTWTDPPLHSARLSCVAAVGENWERGSPQAGSRTLSTLRPGFRRGNRM